MRKYPTCPMCASTSKKCKRPSGHDATQWHIEREHVQALLCRCRICLDWLAKYGIPVEEVSA